MVLRKPYAFLIKNFKIIHIILGVLVAYLTYKTTPLISFLRSYVTYGTLPVANNLAAYYINFFMYLAAFLIIITAVVIYILLYQKKKKTTLYAVVIGYYLLLFILLSISYSILSGMEREMLTGETSRLLRDLSLILYIPQYFFLFFMIFRGIGFDIKKFNFDLDKDKLEIDAKDDEEIEVVVPKDTYKLQRFIRRFIREFRYYVIENTFVFICLCIMVVVLLGTAIFMNVKIYNEKVKVGESFSYKGFTLTNLDSMVTNLNSKGEILSDGKYYVIVTFNVKSNVSNIMDWRDLRLLVGKKIHYPTYTKREHFSDYGNTYNGEKLLPGWDKDYIFVYEIDESLVTSSYKIRIVNNLSFQIGEIVPSYKDLTIRPTLVNKIKTEKPVKLGSELNFKKTTLGESKLKIKNYEITDRYIYSHEYCDPINPDSCTSYKDPISVTSSLTTKKTLLVMDYDLVLADSDYKTSIKNKHIRTFFFTFTKVKYKVDGKEKIVTATDRTPERANNLVIMQLDSDISRATNIELIITIRNTQFTVILK